MVNAILFTVIIVPIVYYYKSKINEQKKEWSRLYSEVSNYRNYFARQIMLKLEQEGFVDDKISKMSLWDPILGLLSSDYSICEKMLNILCNRHNKLNKNVIKVFEENPSKLLENWSYFIYGRPTYGEIKNKLQM